MTDEQRTEYVAFIAQLKAARTLAEYVALHAEYESVWAPLIPLLDSAP